MLRMFGSCPPPPPPVLLGKFLILNGMRGVIGCKCLIMLKLNSKFLRKKGLVAFCWRSLLPAPLSRMRSALVLRDAMELLCAGEG
jgi:hypothetical protein